MASSSNFNTTLTHDEIARRAYEIWNNRGQPAGQDQDIWYEAERSLRSHSPVLERSGSVAREAHANPPAHAMPGMTATGHFIVLLDRGHLRIYSAEHPVGVRETRYVAVDAVDFPDGVKSYSANDSDQAGRFPGSKGRPAGMSIDERLPMRNERDSKLAEQMAQRINRFLQQHATATWDYSAGPALHQPVLDRLNRDVRQRLRTALSKDLVHHPANELRDHFSNGRS
jgi:hypothetical protein